MRSPTIFISYRRDDAIANAGRLFDWLVRQFGGASMCSSSTQSIAPGEKFPATLVERLAQADVLLAVIGPRWASITDAGGQRRLDDPNDFVRLEVSTGLARGIRTIPLLVGGAPMPNVAQPPAELASLSTLNALSVDDLRFEQDFDNLVDAILGRQRGFARRELDRLRRLLLVAKASSLIAPVVALILLFAGLDTALRLLCAGYESVQLQHVAGRAVHPQDAGCPIGADHCRRGHRDTPGCLSTQCGVA